MEKQIMATYLVEVASKLQWGKFLYKVIRKVGTKPNSPIVGYDLLMFDYSTELVELFYKSQILGHVVVNEEGEAMDYLSYVNSNSKYDLTSIEEVERELLTFILDNRLFAVSMDEHASNPTNWREV